MITDPKGYRWPREKSWWDNLTIPRDTTAEEFLMFNAPAPQEHDFIMYTDGSGCTKGWGAYAAVIERVGLPPDSLLESDVRGVLSQDVVFGATYGSTVARSEMRAFLDGLHEILRIRCEIKKEEMDELEKYEASQAGGVLRSLVNDERVSVLWFTDRANIAKSILFNEDGDPLMNRNSEVDLWMRYSTIARHLCITPVSIPRNSVEGQAVCDAVCGVARKTIMAAQDEMAAVSHKFKDQQSWNNKRPQKAQF